MGGGIFGLLWSALLCAKGISCIVLTEPKEGRRRIAVDYLSSTLELSEARAIHPDDLSATEEFDVAIECCGQAEAVEAGYSRLAIGGTLLIFGGPPKHSKITIDPSDILFKEVTIKGSVIGQDTFDEGIQALLLLSERGYLGCEALGMQSFGLESYERATELLKKGDICKAVFSIASC